MPDSARRALLMVAIATVSLLVLWQVVPDRDSRTTDLAGNPIDSAPDLGWLVTTIIDGDTVIVERGEVEETVRFIGIDAPEREECGYDEARQFLVDIILDQEVALVSGTANDRDQYNRLLRYIDYGGLDVGLGVIAEGFAIARYDSRTGQPHSREDVYQEADAGTTHICDDAEGRHSP